MFEELVDAPGPLRLPVLLGRLGRKMAESFGPLPEKAPLGERMGSLVEKMESRGHMTEAEALPEGYALRMYNCPYRELVAAYPALCEMERSMLRHLLGSRVKRSQCILEGTQPYCSYTVVES
jgi:predicted ArsR family transcriptional regulator